jgi:hypothetical protein
MVFKVGDKVKLRKAFDKKYFSWRGVQNFKQGTVIKIAKSGNVRIKLDTGSQYWFYPNEIELCYSRMDIINGK